MDKTFPFPKVFPTRPGSPLTDGKMQPIIKNMLIGFTQLPDKLGACRDVGEIIPSPGGKGDREAVDEERRPL